MLRVRPSLYALAPGPWLQPSSKPELQAERSLPAFLNCPSHPQLSLAFAFKDSRMSL